MPKKIKIPKKDVFLIHRGGMKRISPKKPLKSGKSYMFHDRKTNRITFREISKKTKPRKKKKIKLGRNKKKK